MADIIDFPADPTTGQKYTAPNGNVYEWNGAAWVVGFYDSITQQLDTVAAFLQQVRILLEDSNPLLGEFRYSDESLIVALNQGLLEMYRVRPDIFMAGGFVIPQYNLGTMGQAFPFEMQFVPPLVYYVVGMAQARDDEGTQDTRASAFLAKFLAMLISMS